MAAPDLVRGRFLAGVTDGAVGCLGTRNQRVGATCRWGDGAAWSVSGRRRWGGGVWGCRLCRRAVLPGAGWQGGAAGGASESRVAERSCPVYTKWKQTASPASGGRRREGVGGSGGWSPVVRGSWFVARAGAGGLGAWVKPVPVVTGDGDDVNACNAITACIAGNGGNAGRACVVGDAPADWGGRWWLGRLFDDSGTAGHERGTS